jgi:hypothetical protein
VGYIDFSKKKHKRKLQVGLMSILQRIEESLIDRVCVVESCGGGGGRRDLIYSFVGREWSFVCFVGD